MQYIISVAVLFSIAADFARGQDAKNEKAAPKPVASNEASECPICGKPAKPNCKTEYEGTTYTFATGGCRKKWIGEREASLYHQVGGKPAIDAAVDLFYAKVLADEKVNFFFEDVNMKRQHNKQKEFLSAALGGPSPWTGEDMRKAHASLDLNEDHFNTIAGHLQATLEELKVDEELIGKIIAVVATTRDDVLNRKKKSAE